MKYLTGFMRKECERRRSSKIGIGDRFNDLGAMAYAVAPEWFCGIVIFNVINWERIARNCDSLLKKTMCCGIINKMEFNLEMLVEDINWKKIYTKYLKIGMKQLYGHVYRG